MNVRKSVSSQKGSIIVTILTLTTFLSLTMMSMAVMATSNVSRARGRIMMLQAQYSAESGADAAVAALNSGNDAYVGTGASEVTVLTASRYKSTYTTTVTNGSTAKERIITTTGKVYSPIDAPTAKYIRKIRVTAQRSTTTTASSMVSRNILTIASSVKDVQAKDIYVNGYIVMNKNTTNLSAENITVAGKNTSASNCSIGGAGNLVKPSTFTDPSQTKTAIRLAYNNCVSPPGNISNANFDVLANQTNISTVASMYIPWSQYMDGTYTSAGSCTNWTSGGTTRTIPFVSGSKMTHYPDSASNVSTSCGTNGDMNLGSNQYNITDNAHIRASLCASNGCSPTFYNPSASTLRWVFVEGTINFTQVKTASGSGPIVFVSYGADPASKVSACPTGGAVYIGQQGSNNTNAPAAYFLAMNGVCLDGTKFDATPGLGGVAGKNLYLATQQGQPFYLTLDPTFPVSQIPIDLSWRVTGYERF